MGEDNKCFKKCFVKDILEEKPWAKGSVELFGYVVARYRHYNRTTYDGKEKVLRSNDYLVDDGSGVISCNFWKNQMNHSSLIYKEDFELGSFLSIQGSLILFRNEKRVNSVHISKRLQNFF
jgi:hypothetical protein